MSFPEPFAGRGRRCDPDEQGKRQVPLFVDNPVFSKLIKLGQKEGKTPARMAQALFEEAYAARCSGKATAAQVAAAGDMADALEDDLRQQIAEARAQHRNALSAYDAAVAGSVNLNEAFDKVSAQLVAMTASRDEHLEGRDRALDSWRETQDQLVTARNERDEARRERDELSRRCWNAEAALEQVRAAPAPLLVDVPPLSAGELAPLPIIEPAPAAEPIFTPAEPEPAPPAIGRSTVKAVLMLRGMNETPAEIAKNLALRREIVDQVLRENRA